MTLLSVDHLSLRFGNAAIIKDISFSIAKGEMLALVGESGSGKSLTALSCLGLQPPAARLTGSITLGGEEIMGQTEARLRQIRGRRVGMIFQEPMTALNPLHTIGKQIGEMIIPPPLREDFRRGALSAPPPTPTLPFKAERVRSLLDQVGLAHFKNRLNAYPHQLSGGERQRVMIAIAIANGPDLLIADEPTTAVDVTVQVKILALLKRLQRETGMAILFITHDLTVVRKLADRVAVMSQGEIVEQAATAALFNRPAHPYTQHLLASEPKGEPLPRPDAASGLISCEELKVWFPIKKGLLRRGAGYIKAVDGVSVSVAEGSTVGVVGESGSGKTTLGFALLRLIKSEGRIIYIPPAGGNPRTEVRLDLLPNASLRPFRREMQPVFQDPYSSLNPRMNIRALIAEGLLVHFPTQSAGERERAIDAILADVGLSPEMKERYPHEFSGGQRQRISIARAMVLKPRFVVLDEPTSALDLSVQAQIIALLKSLQAKYGLSYMFISHDLRVIKAIAHHIIVMHEGKIVEQGETAEIFARPRQDYTKSLMDAAFMKG